jgi:hypothetical protein
LSAATNQGDFFQMVSGIVDQKFAEHSHDTRKSLANDE